jgi:hypothetical protein
MESNKKAQNNTAGRAADSHRQKQQSKQVYTNDAILASCVSNKEKF